MPAISNAAFDAADVGPGSCSSADRRREHLERTELAGAHRGGLQVDRSVGVLLGLVGAAQDHRHPAFAGRAEHVLGERVRQHQRIEDLLLAQRLATPGHRVQRAVAERLGRDLGERRLRDAVLVHVAGDLHPEELGGEREARAAVPVLAAWALDAERTGLVLVEPDRHADVGRAGLDRVDRLGERGATGGAAVHDVGERQAGQPDAADHGVGGAAVHRSADGELHVGPLLTAVGEGSPDGDHALVHARDAVVAAELVHSDADDRDVAHEGSPSDVAC